MFRTALDQLALLSVSGVQTHFDIESVPDSIRRGQLPALVVLPVETASGGRRLFPERGEAFEVVGFTGGPRTATFLVTHLLLLAPLAVGESAGSRNGSLIDLIDDYFSALAADVTLGGTLLEPTQVQIEPGVFDYGGVAYTGCAFRHRWVVAL